MLALARVAEGVAREGVGEASLGGDAVAALGRSAAYAGAIATLATLLAWPGAMLAARARSGWLAVLAAPMLLPTYLAYAGWSIARAPTTPLGRLVGEAPERGLDWLPVFVGRGVAVWGLALWAWPLAAIVLSPGLRRALRTIDEPLALDGASAWRRGRTLALAVRTSLVASWGTVFLLMLGSAVPLHVAQVQTYAIEVWRALDDNLTEPWRAWLHAWPLVGVACVAGPLLAGPLARGAAALAEGGGDERPARRASLPLWILAPLPLLLSLVVPFGLFLWSMGGPHVFRRFLTDAREALLGGATVSAGVGALALVACVSVGALSARRDGPPRAVRWLLAASLAWALLPGVLVGSAVAQLVRSGPGWLEDSAAPVVVAHFSRFFFLPVLLGVWLGAVEAAAVRDLRDLDGARGVRGWLATSWAGQAGPLVGVALSCGCLSFHEIESSVRVQPPGLDHLAQRLLQWLHYERMGELSAAGVLLLGIGIVASGVVAAAMGAGHLRTRPGHGR